MSKEEINNDITQRDENSIEEYSDDVADLEDMFPLRLGTALSLKDVYAVSSSESSKVVVFAGSNGCGKTTLLTALYQQFLTQPLKRYYFAGSNTLQAFEDRAFYNRVQSQQNSPNMIRTATGSLDSFLHLRLFDTKTESINNLFVSDFSGEDFNRVSGYTELAVEEFSMLRQTRLFFIILDGAEISSRQHRNRELHKAIQLLRTFLDAGILHPETRIVVVLSKYDLIIEKMEEDDSVSGFIESILGQISDIPSSNSCSLELCKVAAMPEREIDIQQGFGIDKLMDIFFNDKNCIQQRVEYKSKSVSQFNLFGELVNI